MIRKNKYILFFIICLLFSDSNVGYTEENINGNGIISVIATANVKGETDPCG